MKNKGEGEQSNLVVEGKGEVRGFWGLNLDNQPQQWWVEGRNRSAIDQGRNYGRRRGFKREDEGNSNLDMFPWARGPGLSSCCPARPHSICLPFSPTWDLSDLISFTPLSLIQLQPHRPPPCWSSNTPGGFSLRTFALTVPSAFNTLLPGVHGADSLISLQFCSHVG